MNPFPVILSSPSGGGKTTIAMKLLEARDDVGYSVSCTTRAPREGEREGRDYYFRSRESFEQGRQRGEFAESAEVHGQLYGTLRSEVERVISEGRHVVMDIDVQGAKQFMTAFPHSVLIFILPPSAEVMIGRLKARGSEDNKSLVRRLKSAKEELKAVDFYQYVIVNDRIEAAVSAVSSIVEAEEYRRTRAGGLSSRLADLMGGVERAIDHHSKGQ